MRILWGLRMKIKNRNFGNRYLGVVQKRVYITGELCVGSKCLRCYNKTVTMAPDSSQVSRVAS